jgi:hypothetical protein
MSSENISPVDVNEMVYVLAPVSKRTWMKTAVLKLIARVGEDNVYTGFEVKDRPGLFLFDDVVGGASDFGTWYPASRKLSQSQLSMLWKGLLGNDLLATMSIMVKDSRDNGRSFSDTITDLLGMLPPPHEIGMIRLPSRPED